MKPAYVAVTLIPFFGFVIKDLDNWAKARQTDRNAPFDWAVAGPMWLYGAMTSVMSGLTLWAQGG